MPGTQKIYLKTWGCSHNNSDSEYMAGQLASYGYKIVGKELLILYLILDKRFVIMWFEAISYLQIKFCSLYHCTVKSMSVYYCFISAHG